VSCPTTFPDPPGQCSCAFPQPFDPVTVAGSQIFSIATNHSIDWEFDTAMKTMQNAQPSGVTTLTEHLRAIHDEIHSGHVDKIEWEKSGRCFGHRWHADGCQRQ
jgi:hypothetical protein